MSPSPQSPRSVPPDAGPDWEAFYRDYRKPGYIDGFEITSKLGGGAFGLVFRARRMSIGKDYAIKFLRIEDGEVRRALVAELEQVNWFAQIDHPNLVAIEDRGMVDGIPFLVMAFAGTETLRDKLVEGRVPAADEKQALLGWFAQAARGLQALHERSLVHFDIKPANVFLRGPVARLGDYGLSKLVTHSRGSLSIGRGTPYYMAPELLQRRGDHRSDIYSLGVVLYEVLCGKVPFTGDSEWEVLRQHEVQEPLWPAHLTPVERAVLQRCLQKDPAARYPSVHDVLAAFGGMLGVDGVRPGAASPPPPPPPQPAEPSPPSPQAAGPMSWEDMAKASREAVRHARVVAREAGQQAGKATREAAKQAHRAVHQAWLHGRAYGKRRWRVLQALAKSKLSPDVKQRMQQAATRIAAGFRRQRSHFAQFLRTVAFAVGTLLVLLVATAMFWVVRSVAPQPRIAASSAPVLRQAAGEVAPSTTSSSTTAALRAVVRVEPVPAEWRSLVTAGEPQWADESQPTSRRRRLLREAIDRLRERAPLSFDKRRDAELPRFAITASPLVPTCEHLVDTLLRLGTYDDETAAAIVGSGPVGLAVAARRLAGIDYADGQDRRSAQRLHRLLVEATACRDLELWEHDFATDAELAAYNRPLGGLWLWFVHEFATTDRAWAFYRSSFVD